MKIKVKLMPGGKMPEINEKGDLFDLFAAEHVELKKPQSGVLYQKDNVKLRDVTFDSALVRLGVCMELPKGFKANLAPRSSTFHKWFVIFANSIGQIDSTYNGDTDEWLASLIAFDHTTINVGDKIAQFEIVPSQRATIWQKLKWLFSSKIEFVQVDSLGNEDRGGIGSTGDR